MKRDEIIKSIERIKELSNKLLQEKEKIKEEELERYFYKFEKIRMDMYDDVRQTNLWLDFMEAEGIPEILQANVKKGGKYIVFLPVVDEIEDEDGNVIGRKKGKEKLADYEKQISEYFKDSDIKPNFHSMLGEYGDKDNNRRLEEFQNRDTDETEFMLVMNKANEGLHLDKLDGIVWLRALDENSRILYLQQLGRVIYSEDPDNPTKDDDRPVVIDLVNNTLKVNWDNEITEQDDIELLTIIVDWVEKHDGTLPDINSNDKEDDGYATVLKDIQNKYKGYLDNDFEDLNEKQIEEVQEILRLGSLIDLWQRELPDKIAKNGGDNRKGFGIDNGSPFELVGVLKDFVELENEVEEIEGRNDVERFIYKLEKLHEIGIDVSKLSKRDTIQTLAEKSGITKEQLEEAGLNPNDNIGMAKSNVASAYRGISKAIPPTGEQVSTLSKMGISLCLQRKNAVDEFISNLEALLAIGIDVSKIKTKDTIETLAQRSGIELEYLRQTELDLNYKIGKSKDRIKQSLKGKKGNLPPTEEQMQKLKDLGVDLGVKRITGKEIAEASISSLKDIEMADEENKAL